MNMYMKLGIMSVLSFISMYVLMYSMIDQYDDAYLSVTRAYMAAAMTAPMLIFAIVVMGSMYKNKKANITIAIGGIVLLIAAVYAMREQAAIYETQFLRSMIPHHSSAILMCENPRLQDPQVIELCKQIIEAQQSEIREMNRMLAEHAAR